MWLVPFVIGCTVLLFGVIFVPLAIIMPRWARSQERGKQETARTQISAFKTALQDFYLDSSFFPTSEMGLEALIRSPTDSRIQNYPEGGYLDTTQIPQDPWGNEYLYVSPGVNNKDFDLESYGRDALDGGEGFDQDIESWRL